MTTSAKLFRAKNPEGEALNKSMQISSPNIRRESCKDQDPQAAYGHLGHTICPFVIPEFVNPFAISSDEDRWDDRKLTGVNLLKNWGKLTLKHCRNWQRDSTSTEWAKSLMMTSCDVLLVDRIDEKFDELDLYEQGGVSTNKVE